MEEIDNFIISIDELIKAINLDEFEELQAPIDEIREEVNKIKSKEEAIDLNEY